MTSTENTRNQDNVGTFHSNQSRVDSFRTPVTGDDGFSNEPQSFKNKAGVQTVDSTPATSQPVSPHVSQQKMKQTHEEILEERREGTGNFVKTSYAEKRYTPSGWRWINLAAYVFAMIGTAFMMVTFAPVADNVVHIYDTTELIVNLQTMSFFISYIFINFPAVSALEKGTSVGSGVYYSFKIATFVTVLCVWARAGIMQMTDNLAYISIPQFIAAFMQPFLMNGCSKLASIWFGTSELTVATALGALSLPMGCVFCFAVGPFFVKDEYAKGDHEQGREAIRLYLVVVATIVSVLSLPMLLLYSQKPKEFPSESAEEYALQFEAKQEQGDIEYDFKGELKVLLGNKSYMLMATCFTMVYAVYTTLSTIINSITKPYNYTSGQSAIISITFVIAGLIGTTVQSILLDKFKNYLQMLRINCVMAFLVCAAGVYGLPSGNMAIICPNIALLGFFVLPIFSISYTFAVELTYPISEAMSNGIMVFTSQIMGTLLSFAGTAILGGTAEKTGPLICIAMFGTVFLIAAMCTICIKQELRRMNFGKDNELKRSQQEGAYSSVPQHEIKANLLETHHDSGYV